ncbi:MAG: threonine/serine exporter family protein [Oscillospiraceae bacterium]|nr:threonine/serine exporter family protein [Oscillospiraceae bacterium]
MNYNLLMDLAIDLGYELAMSGAETFRVEESVTRLLTAYGVDSDVFAIPNYIMITIRDQQGTPITRMRRIGYHGNNMDSVEKFSALSRALDAEKPPLDQAHFMLAEARRRCRHYSLRSQYIGHIVGAGSMGMFFGGTWMDGICAGLCGLLVGIVDKYLDKLKANQFFRTIIAAFLMALLAYTLSAFGICPNPDAVTIGALMLLVPGLLFTNAMRDIIYGDTNSGVNRIVQVFLIAAALSLGTAAAWHVASVLWSGPVNTGIVDYGFWGKGLLCFISCLGFSILFNIHDLGVVLCALGATIAWAVFCITEQISGSGIMGYLAGAMAASAYAETLARIRKFPAITYLVISILPLIPGSGVYYTMNYAVRGDMDRFASQGMYTAAIAGIMAVGILLVSTLVRVYNIWRSRK